MYSITCFRGLSRGNADDDRDGGGDAGAVVRSLEVYSQTSRVNTANWDEMSLGTNQ